MFWFLNKVKIFKMIYVYVTYEHICHLSTRFEMKTNAERKKKCKRKLICLYIEVIPNISGVFVKFQAKMSGFSEKTCSRLYIILGTTMSRLV